MSHQGFFRHLVEDIWMWVDTWLHPDILCIAHEKAGSPAAYDALPRDKREEILRAAVAEFNEAQRLQARCAGGPPETASLEGGQRREACLSQQMAAQRLIPPDRRGGA